jgi:hypothetical protein
LDTNLEIMETVRQRKAKYCRYLDTKQFDQWEALFKPDAKIVFYNPDNTVAHSFESAKNLSTPTRSLFATTQTIHQTHNSEIDFKSTTELSAIWSMEDWHIYAPEGDNPSKTMHGYGFYHETWELVEGSWLIAKLELRRKIVQFT